MVSLPGHISSAGADQIGDEPDLLDSMTRGLFQVGLSLQAIDPPQEADRQCLAHALQCLDDTIREIRDHVFTTRGRASSQPPAGAGQQPA